MEKNTTLPFDKGSARIIAHRGLSGIERENTLAAFIAAGNRSYFGIETDVHRTIDGKYILIHDGTTKRVADRNLPVEESSLADLRALKLTDLSGNPRGDLILPTPEEYFSVCRRYGKVSVFELKSSFTGRELTELVEIAKSAGQLENTIFISFDLANLLNLLELYPEVSAQYLTDKPVDASMIRLLKQYRLDLDIREDRLNQDTVDALHAAGITVNCWTVDDPARAAELAAMGVDMITSNILE